MASNQTRISIESVDDWNRIRDNFTNTMLAVIDECLAKNGSEHVREAVTAHLLQWRDDVFNAAAENIRVDGRNLEDYTEAQEETEPFDEILDRRIWSLSTERMNWDKELAERRRTVPTEVQHLMEDLLARQRAAEYVPPPLDVNEDEEIDDSDGRLKNEKGVADVFNQVTSLATTLQTTVPETLERIKRVHKVADDIKNLPS